MNYKIYSEDDRMYVIETSVITKFLVFFAVSVCILMSQEPIGLGRLLHPLPPDIKKTIRQLEKVSFKLTREKCKIVYNRTCIHEDILPMFICQ